MHSAKPDSWGRFPIAMPRAIHVPASSYGSPLFSKEDAPALAYGMGRSYGDVCLNDGGTVIVTKWMDNILEFDRAGGRLRVESGASLADIINVIVPQGWFLPVTPGTKYVSIGGAVANDVHGKNHHNAGSFGCHVSSLKLCRSSGELFECSRTENSDLFAATVGGLGLTGVITEVTFNLLPVRGRSMVARSIRAGSIREALSMMKQADDTWDYTVAWADLLRKSPRCLVLLGNHQAEPSRGLAPWRPSISFPFDAPNFLLMPPLVKAFNWMWYRKQITHKKKFRSDLEPFFYPLDMLGNWNRLYGGRGLLQYQAAVPDDSGEVVQKIVSELRAGGASPYLAVVKRFGSKQSPGLLSFPIAGSTISIDFPNSGNNLFRALDRADNVVADAGGRIYAAKDARVDGEMFRSMYPAFDEFMSHVDPAVSSSFLRRIVGDRRD